MIDPRFYQALSWVSAWLAMTSIYLAGRKVWWCWLFYIANSCVLLAINIHFRLWGFIPLSAITSVMYVMNARKWKKDKEIPRRSA